MALFKISKGLKANLPSTKTEGYCWYTTDDSLFYIDYKDENGTLQRRALNAKDAETLMGASLSTILNSSDVEIPTSKAVLGALDDKVDKVDGKGLSTNDLTNTLKNNYDAAYTHSTSTHAPSDAEKNVIVGVQKNGTDVSVGSDRKVNITIPTSASDIGAASLADLQSHIENSDIHVTADEKAAWSESDIFIAIYGTTTSAEIEAAYQAGKAVFFRIENGKSFGCLCSRWNATSHYFISIRNKNIINYYVCENNVWSIKDAKAIAASHASTHATGGSDPITPASIGAAPISTLTEVTLSAASWSGDSAPYTYTLTVNGVTDTSTQEIVFATSINLEQLTAGQNANIQDGGQSANTIVLKAWGEKPTVDLPIRVIMRG